MIKKYGRECKITITTISILCIIAAWFIYHMLFLSFKSTANIRLKIPEKALNIHYSSFEDYKIIPQCSMDSTSFETNMVCTYDKLQCLLWKDDIIPIQEKYTDKQSILITSRMILDKIGYTNKFDLFPCSSTILLTSGDKLTMFFPKITRQDKYRVNITVTPPIFSGDKINLVIPYRADISYKQSLNTSTWYNITLDAYNLLSFLLCDF